MNRRILLIDADSEFYARLTELLRRYRLDIVVNADPDDAIAEGAVSPPAVILLAVDEPEKLGFKTFQQIKKGPLAKIPIVLATRTVPPSAMNKHRSLKTNHADEYFDKRSLSDDELLGKLDNLIQLGEPINPSDIDIPLEIDDIPMDGDVLEETVGEDSQSAYRDDKTQAGHSDVVDQMVAAETDAAFDALLGDFGSEAPPVIDHAAPAPAPEPGGTPEPALLAHEPVHAVVEDHATTIAPPIHDPTPIPAPLPHDPKDDVVVAPLEAVPQTPAVVAEPEPAPHRFDSSPAIMLDSDDLIDEDDSGGIPEVVPHVNLVRQDEPQYEEEPAIPVAVVDAPVPEPVVEVAPEPVPEPVPSIIVAPEAHRPPTAPEHRPPTAPPLAIEARTTRPIPAVVDLGLDDVAADAENEQSGVFDRKSLRKIGELERQVAQLKAELDRARASAEPSAPRGTAQREFFNLKEQILAKDTELRRLGGELDAKTREAADAEERIRQIQQMRTDLDAKAAELEQRVATDAAKATALAAKEKMLTAQLAQVQQDLEAKTQAHAASETARTQLERDLATERATRAASASDAERTLRVEREQMIARHQGELSALRVENAGAQAVALEKLRQELAGGQQAALDAARAEREAALDVTRKQAAAAVEAARAEVGAEADQAIARLEAQQTADLQRLRDDHAAETTRAAEIHAQALANAKADAAAELAKAREQAAAQLAGAATAAEHATVEATRQLEAARAQHAAELAAARNELAAQAATSNAAHDRAIAELTGQLEAAKAETANVEAVNAKALADQTNRHALELATQANQHAAAMAAREADLNTTRQDEAIAHTAALAELRAELDRQAAAHGIKLDGAKRELDEALALHEQAKAKLVEEQRRIATEQARAHAAELAKVDEEKKSALGDISRAQIESKKALAEAAAMHANELAQQKELAEREIAELKSMLVQAKRAIEEATARHTSEREAADAANAQALAEQKAQAERALAVANGEVVRVKAVADAEHQRAMMVKEAELDKKHKALLAEQATVVKDLTNERDELQRGLSAARDTIKRSEGELAAAVQTIADRNAELRGHAAAIGERDQRIADLRKEIEGLETENASYQDQVLRAYQKIKSDEAMVARAKKAMAIALTVLDDDPKPKAET